MAKELSVYLEKQHIGNLIQTYRGARFAYDEDIYTEYMGMPLLSASLPVKMRPYSEGLTNAWFRGLLPEGRRLDVLSQKIGCTPSDYVRILA